MKRILCILPLLSLAACEGKREDRSKVLAKISGTNFSQSDFDFMLKTLSDDRQAEMVKDPEARRRQFELILKQKLQSMAAQKTKLGKSATLNGRQGLIDQRIVSQYYFQTFLAECNGLKMDQLKAYYQANPTKFSNDSGKVKPFSEVRSAVADSVIASKAPIDSFYQTNTQRYQQKAYCELSLLQTPNKKTMDEAKKAIAGGASFADAATKFSIHAASKGKQGKFGRVNQGESMWELGMVNSDSLLFADATKLKPGQISKPFKRDSTWVIVKIDTCQPQMIPALDKIRRQVTQDYLTQYKSLGNDNAVPALKAKYGVKYKSDEAVASTEALHQYYEAHKDSYLSPESYDVYDVESKNKEQLAKRVKEVKDLEGFKKLAASFSENTWTKADQGHVGWIKRDFCLPDGIGMMPTLFISLDTMKPGLVNGAYQNPDTKKWHAFWLVAKQPKQTKPFERVLGLIKTDIKSERQTNIKAEDTLVTYAKNKVLREKDVNFLREEIPLGMQDRYTRDALVDFLLTWDLSYMEAKSLGLLDDEKLLAQREENKMNYWAQIYNDSILSKTGGLDSGKIKKAFEANRPYFTKDSTDKDYHKYVRDVAAFLILDPKELDIEYKTNPERYKKDTIPLSFEDSRYDIFQNLKSTAYAKFEVKQVEGLEREFQVVIMDPTLLPAKIKNPQEAYKQAQNLHFDRKLDVAVDLYLRLRNDFPKNESLQDSICFGLAQIYIEQEKYQQALAEYHRLSYLYAKSANNYKAMFMVGFIHAEHLKNDSAAVRAFEKMLKQYPSSDLSDDADWMIRNIRSGGKLMPVLEGDSGYVAPDSGKGKTGASPLGKKPEVKKSEAASAPATTAPAASTPASAVPAAGTTPADAKKTDKKPAGTPAVTDPKKAPAK